jgi:type I restriction enzyme, S subunit
MVRVKHLVDEIDERLGDAPAPELLSVSIHQGVVARSSMTDKLPRAEELAAYKCCRSGDIAVNRMRAFQGGLGRVPVDGIVSPDYTVLRPHRDTDTSFLHHLFRSTWFVGEMTARLRGIGNADQGNVRTPRINFTELGGIRVPTPPLDEQTRLATELDRSAAQLEALHSVTTASASLVDARARNVGFIGYLTLSSRSGRDTQQR